MMTVKQLQKTILKLRAHKPLILNLTNFVTRDFVANCLLALGAAPIMSVSKFELEELVTMCSAINVNIGTLDDVFIKRVKMLLGFAHKYDKPIVFDPVGAGATKIRTKISQELMQHAAIVRGNASEIIALSGIPSSTKGVESENTTDDAKKVALDLACNNKCTVVVSGPIDFITDGFGQLEIPYGSSLMPFVTGMGCALTAVITAFRGVIENSFEASAIGTSYFALCGEMASQNAKHPGIFRTHLIDCLHAADYRNMKEIYAK